MKLQNMAIIFIIIILPISVVLENYVKSKVETINIQSQYDSKLLSATYDAIKAYQINSFNNTENSLVNAKLRDIKASVNTFYNSISTNFSSLGYSKSALQNYIPALVYTMYDGYYIYGPFTNTWDEKTSTEHQNETYKKDEILYSLKPYVYYSCRYRKDADNDVVITYSLDNYIQIQGKVKGQGISKYGYVLGGVPSQNGEIYTTLDNTQVNINKSEQLAENIVVNGIYYPNVKYVKIDGTKYYQDDNIVDGKVFFILNGKATVQSNMDSIDNNQAIKYYKNAYEMQQYLENELGWLNTDFIYSSENLGNEKNNYQSVGKVFDFSNIGKEDSNFNTHRMDVIKNAINKNLSVAISNYNHYYNTSTDFQMPKLKETDWEKIMGNISMISFMQGMNIGGKIYNGYAIVNNNKNFDVVMDDSILIKTSDNEVHRITENGLKNSNLTGAEGIFNIDLERRSEEVADGTIKYYYPINVKLSYDSIVTQNNVSKNYKVENLKNPILAQVYYTALGRERYSLYRQALEY